MFDTLCSLPLSSDLFAQVVHPSEPLVAVGLSGGHVATLKLPPVEGSIPSPTASNHRSRSRRDSNGTGVIETAWRTKRHKGSCRCLAYSHDGRTLYSAGTDGLVKAADSATGVVIGKVAVPYDPSTSATVKTIDSPTVMHALSPQTLLLSTDSGALHIYDLRDPAPSVPITNDSTKTAFISARPSQTFHPHTDYISDLAPIPASAASTSGFSKQWLSTGSTTLALTDLRRGVLAKSEDQEELLLSCLYITGLPVKKSSGTSGEKAVVGGGDGVITLWEKGQWDDQDERIVVSREGETLDCLAQVPDGIGGLGKKVAVGMGDGKIKFVRLGMNKIVSENQHDEVEGVVELGFDVEGRMISGGGQIIKVWSEHIEGAEEEDAEEEDVTDGKRAASDSDEDSDDDDDDDDDSSDDETARAPKRKKQKSNGLPGAGTNFNFSGLD